MITISNKSDADRNLPAADYGHFDIRMTEDGKEFSTPHTLGATALSIMSERKALVAVASLCFVITLSNPIKEPNSLLNRYWLYLALTFLLVHLICTFTVLVFTAATGIRKVTRLTIREDGLVWNRTHFFPVEHIWGVGYGTTFDEGKASEVYKPLITIVLGVHKIVLAEGLDVPSAALFKRVFSDDIRRYWHRHH